MFFSSYISVLKSSPVKTKEQEKYKHTCCMKEKEVFFFCLGFFLMFLNFCFAFLLLTSSSDRVFVSVVDFHVKNCILISSADSSQLEASILWLPKNKEQQKEDNDKIPFGFTNKVSEAASHQPARAHLHD